MSGTQRVPVTKHISSAHRRWRVVVLIFACLLAVAWLRSLTGVLSAQTATPTVPAAETLTATPPVSAANESTPAAVVTSEAEITVSFLPAAPVVDTDQVKALIRARIVALLRARLAMSFTETVTSTETVTTTEHVVAIPLVLDDAAEEEATVVAAVATSQPIAQVEATPTSAATPIPATPIPAAVTLPLPTPDGVVRTARVPILMYHYLSEPPADADIYRRDLSVTPALFAQHLDRLLAEGYTTIRLEDLLLNLTQGTPLPAKPVILTFDDGYRDNYVNAFPLLKARGMTATFFIVTDFIDAQRPEYLSWDMVREMYAGGMAIESHGRNHASLANRDDDYLIWQALGSLETIEYELGVRPHFVSYPAGDYDANTIRIFQSAHYWLGLTTKQGATHRSDDLFQLNRVRIRGTTTADDLAELLALDW